MKDMAAITTVLLKQHNKHRKVEIHSNETPSLNARLIEDVIRMCAYKLWESRGRVHGFHQQDWVDAELEIRQPLIEKCEIENYHVVVKKLQPDQYQQFVEDLIGDLRQDVPKSVGRGPQEAASQKHSNLEGIKMEFSYKRGNESIIKDTPEERNRLREIINVDEQITPEVREKYAGQNLIIKIYRGEVVPVQGFAKNEIVEANSMAKQLVTSTKMRHDVVYIESPEEEEAILHMLEQD
jgi:hypothetical protein